MSICLRILFLFLLFYFNIANNCRPYLYCCILVEKNYTLDIIVSSMITNATNITVVLLDETGNDLSSLMVTFTEHIQVQDRFCRVVITIPTQV